MKKKIFTLLTLALAVCSGAWADTAIISPANMTSQSSGTLESTIDGNVWYGNDTNLEKGFIIQITGNRGKALSNQSTVTVNSNSYSSFKNSNGAEMTLTLPTGYKAKSVTFYVTTNADDDANLSEINGTSCSDVVTSHKDGTNPTVITKELSRVNSFTFTFSTKQVFFVAVVDYQLPVPDITTQPVSATYQKDATATALTVAATASAGDLSYQWYSCDDANKSNAAVINGETSSSYTPSTASVGTFYYFCRVADTNGTTDSNVATITVAEAYAPIVTAAATSLEVLQYETATLGVTVDAVPEATIQWYSCDDANKTNAAAIDGATSATYAPSTETVGTYYFYAVATNAQGTTTSDVITLTVNADITGQTFYSWNKGTQSGGTVVASDGESVYSDYIRLNGKNDFSDKTVTITLTNALKAGDQIKVTAYRNKNATDKQSGFKAKFEKGSATVASSTGLEFVNINEAVSGTSEYGTEPNTCVFAVPASAAGSKTITMTRSHTSTNLFITKIEIYRPAIALNAVLNAEGLLTADEIANTAEFSFGVTATNERVADDAANAVAVLSGKYHNDHGCTGLKVVAKVPGAVKITIGQCTYSEGTITIVNSSNEKVALLKPNSPACWKNSTANVDVFYYTGESTTLTISGMSYCPYVAIEEIDAADAVINITPAYEKTTYVSTMPLDFSSIDGLKAYIASAATGGSVTLTEVTTVPPATPLVLIGTASTKYSVPASSSLTAVGDNLLRAGDGTTEFDGSTFDYILYSDGLFYQIGEGTVATTKAYLHCESDPTAAGSRSLAISFGDETTGISSMHNSQCIMHNEVYDLQGRRVSSQCTVNNSQLKKGLYIVNGKKVIK